MIVVGGMIGLGKTSVATILAEHFDANIYLENVEGNEILPLFYTASKEEQQKKRYPFLLQLDFLQSRFKDVKGACQKTTSLLDRSIYEDWYFAKVNNDLGNISNTEFSLYEKILAIMLEEINEMPQKTPELMIYLQGSFETVMARINERGRDFEQDAQLNGYYHTLWQGYDAWVMKQYQEKDLLIINMDETDVVNDENDKQQLIKQVEAKLVQLSGNSKEIK